MRCAEYARRLAGGALLVLLLAGFPASGSAPPGVSSSAGQPDPLAGVKAAKSGAAEGTARQPLSAATEPEIRVGLAHVRRASLALSGTFALRADGAHSGSSPALPPTWQGTLTAEPHPQDPSRILVHLPGHPPAAVTQLDVVHLGEGEFYFQGVPYRGSVRLLRHGDDVVVVNVLPLESYLMGVVPREMPASWHPEALKAQAVAARTYAWAQRGRFASWGYDLTADARSQVYGGILAERPETTLAVLATKGEILLYAGKPAAAYYSASNGGYTADPREVWGGSVEYLRAEPDPYDASTGAHANWEVRLSPGDLAGWIPEGAEIQDVRIAERGLSGRVVRLEIVTDRGVSVYWRDEVRSVLQAKSTLLDAFLERIGAKMAWVIGDRYRLDRHGQVAITRGGNLANIAAAPVVQGAWERRQLPGGETTLVVRGSGWGHGVGLSQWGAQARAEAGQDYRAILAFYYPGTTIGTIGAAESGAMP